MAPDREVQEEVLVLRAARVRDEAIELADAGRHSDAHAVMLKMVGDLRASGLADEADLLEEQAPDVSPATYHSGGRKSLNYASWQSRRNRRAS